MGIRFTGFSTPIFGANWEYSEYSKKDNDSSEKNILEVKKKINIFISSNINESYTEIRKSLKRKIESTGIANVYLFEDSGSSTMSAREEYLIELQDCDLCIFLIDNYDGVNSGTQLEIDFSRKQHIKSLYYFCDEKSKEKTSIEESLLGADNVKISYVHSFLELGVNGFNDLIKDIISVYHNYCEGRLLYCNSLEETQELELPSINASLLPIPKSVLKEVDKCKIIIEKFTLNKENLYGIEVKSTNEIDSWCSKFLEILLFEKSIKDFNLSLFLNTLSNYQEQEYFELTSLRWKAIQYYFLGDIEKCIENTEKALEYAKQTHQQSWVIKDILIDLRNQKRTRDISKNIVYSKLNEQEELTNSNEQLFYPIMDRLISSLRKQYVDSMYKNEIDSPFSVSLGSNIDQCAELISSAYIVAMYNGSLTHILLLYDRIKELLFYLSINYDNWEIKCNLLKLEVFDGNCGKVKKILNAFPVLLNKMNSKEAKSIIEFSNNHPIKYKRELSKIIGLGCVGYYLEEQYFEKINVEFNTLIDEWLNKEKSVMFIGDSILYTLDSIAYRFSADELAMNCCKIIENHYSRWFNKVFSIISLYIDINILDIEISNRLLKNVEKCFEKENERNELSHVPNLLINFQKQNKGRTSVLDSLTKEYFPNFYNDRYELELTDSEDFFIKYILKCIDKIKYDNEMQGKNGHYYGNSINYIDTILSILKYKKVKLSSDIILDIIGTMVDTLLYSKQNISNKNSSILLLLIIFKYYANSKDYIDQINKLSDNKSNIEVGDALFLSSNIDLISIKISLNILLSYLGFDVHSDLIKLLSLLKNDTATIYSVSEVIDNFFEIIEDDMLDDNISIIILQNVLIWLRSDYFNTRWHALNILVFLTKTGKYNSVLNNEILHLVDNDSPYIKTRLLRMLNNDFISLSTKEYVESKCKNDSNYVVRKVLKEIKDVTE